MRSLKLFLLLVFCLLTSAANAQDDGDRGRRRGRDERGSEERGRDERRGGRGNPGVEMAMRRLDTNRNGMIDPAEVPSGQRATFSQLAVRAGLDPRQPLSIEQLQRADTAARARTSNNRQSNDRRRGRDDEKAEPKVLVAGFGTPQELAKVPGFGAQPAESESDDRRRGDNDRERRRNRDDDDEDDNRRQGRGEDRGERRGGGGGPWGGGGNPWAGGGGAGGNPWAGGGGNPWAGRGPGGGGNPWAGGGFGGPPGGGFGGPPGGGFGGASGGGFGGRTGGDREGRDRDGDRGRDRDGDRRDRRRDEDDDEEKKPDTTAQKEEPKKEEPKKEGGDAARQKFARYAQGLLNQYDKNKNGVLEKEEWSTMRGEPQKADADGDSKVTLDELTNQLASYSTGSSSSSSGSSSSSTSGRSGSSAGGGSVASSSGGRPMRFLTPTERLPSGLPGWFTQSDRDGDGQVMMSEYASYWSEEKIKEFTKYDLNTDGTITPGECLRADR